MQVAVRDLLEAAVSKITVNAKSITAGRDVVLGRRRQRTNVERQEEIVSVLWDFAHDLQTLPLESTSSNGTKVNIDAVGKALEKIMQTFGYGVVEIQ